MIHNSERARAAGGNSATFFQSTAEKLYIFSAGALDYLDGHNIFGAELAYVHERVPCQQL